MEKKRVFKLIIFAVIMVALIAALLTACKPPSAAESSKYGIVDNETNKKYKELSTKDEAIDRATGGLNNLLEHLDSTTVSETGYFIGGDIKINTEDGSAFILRLRANLYTYPYDKYKKGTPEYDHALAKHNELIKKNDVIIEWYNGASNTMLLGFYFDGVNPGSEDPGNNLYLNVQGKKRLHPKFGDTVLYQQIIRLITKFNLDSVLASTTSTGTSSSAVASLADILKLTVNENYVVTQNQNVGSIFFHDMSLTPKASDISGFVNRIFAPFDNKVDPLSFKYLGFMFSTLGKVRFSSLDADMRFLVEPNEVLGKEILNGVVMDVRGDANVKKYNKVLQRDEDVLVPFTTSIGVNYSIRVSTDIVFDKSNYVLYDYGNYEYTGDMYMPQLDLRLDMLVRTDVNKFDNKRNKAFVQCRELDTDKTVIGLYYTNELTYIDIKGITELYGGVHFEDIGLPQAYRGGWNMADTLKWLSDFIDEYIVIAVDNILDGNKKDEEGKFGEVTRIIMKNIESKMKDEDDPASRATIRVKIDMALIREVLTATSKTNTNFTNEQLIYMINQQFNIDLEAVASILGIGIDELLDRSYVHFTYDVDYGSIKIEVFSAAEKPQGSPADLYLRMNLYPQKMGEYVPINFGDLSKFKEMQDVMTYSGKLEGQFIFANDEIVDMSKLLGSFMGDKSGKNTPYILPSEAKVDFELYYDQYIREQILENGRWTRSGRSAFDLRFNVVEGDKSTPILRIYGNDVSFNSGLPIEQHGYVWLDYVCVPNLPKFKVREDLFLTSFYEYMGYDFEVENPNVVLGLTDLLRAIMEDSWVVYEPEVIRITTSNKTVKKFFNVDKMIATFNVAVRFKQQVFNIDQLSREFAMYTVGNLGDLVGTSPYYLKLHETIKVLFDFGDRYEERDFFFDYDAKSIDMISGREFYRPAIDDRFMGVTRDYLVRITDRIGRQKIKEFRDKRQEWEPLNPAPTTGVVYYGNEGLSHAYNVDYLLHAVYDRDTDYYTVLSEDGYENIYDFENNVYILSLGSALNFKKAYELVGEIPHYLREYSLTNDIAVRYEFNSHVPGVYVVTKIGNNAATGRALYLKDHDIYIAFSDEMATAIKNQDSTAKVYEITHETSGVTTPTVIAPTVFNLDFRTAKYYSKITVNVVDSTGTSVSREVKIRYDKELNVYNFTRVEPATFNTSLTRAIKEVLGEDRVLASDDLDWESKELSHIDFGTYNVDSLDWSNEVFATFAWTALDWEDMTLEGGLYIVKATIGRGMMATYVENIVIKVINRTIDTEKYVMVNTESKGKVRAPVATAIDVDPYVYLTYKAFYVNNLNGDPNAFATWFFEKYMLTFKFTKIYIENPEENTPDEIARFNWYFDKADEGRTYSDVQINNKNRDNMSANKTYVYTIFQNQVIALEIRVLFREFKEIRVSGETEPNTYTIDALDPNTYYLPKNLIFVFSGNSIDADGNIIVDTNGDAVISEFTLDYNDIAGSTIFATLQEYMPRIQSLPKANNGLDLIKWANPKATNVKLINDQVDGHVKPFLDIDSNVTHSAIDFMNCFDKNMNWYHEDWFYINTATITVEIPDKVVSTFNREIYGENHVKSDEVHHNIQIKKYYSSTDTTNSTWGYFAVDPYDESTWVLPRSIYVYFDTKVAGQYFRKEYTVSWSNLENDNNHYFIETEEGYLISNVTRMPKFFRLRARIGDASINFIDFEIIVINRSGLVEEVSFYDETGTELPNVRIDTSYNGDISPYTSQALAYIYDVNTYARFKMPRSINVKFRDESSRTYILAKWGKNNPDSNTFEESDPAKYRLGKLSPWNPNKEFKDVASVIGSSIKEKIFLIFKTDIRKPTQIKLLNKDDNICNISISEEADDINGANVALSGIRIDYNGKVCNKNTGELILVNGLSLNIYQYIKHLFSNIEVEFADESIIVITDAATSADDKLYAEIDLQEVLKDLATGQIVKVFLGQGEDAHNLNVQVRISTYTIKNEYALAEMQQEGVYIIRVPALDAFNTNNTPKYPNGYIFKDQFSFTIIYKSGDTFHYGRNADDRAVPLMWSVVMPPMGITEDSGREGMMGYYGEDDIRFEINQKISSLDTQTIYGGGWLWISTILPDASRVYVRLESASIDIGSNYDSQDPASRFVIRQGRIEIDNLYDLYPLGNNLIASRLPSIIVLSNGLRLTNINWQVTMPNATLNAIDYHGNMSSSNEDRAFAKARIMREEVILYLDVLSTEVMKIKYTDPVFSTRSFATNVKNVDGIIKLEFDIYQNIDYGGNFVLPLDVSFIYPDRATSYIYKNIEFKYFKSVDQARTCREIPYNINGIAIDNTSPDYSLLDGNRDIQLFARLKDNQELMVLVHFNNKEIKEYEFANLGTTSSKLLTINPYSEYTTVPNDVTIKFLEGPDYVFRATWQKPEGFNGLFFNTYREKITPLGNTSYRFESVLSAKGQVSSQPMFLNVTCLDYIIDTWEITAGDQDAYIANAGINTSPNAKKLFLNPFEEKISSLPQTIANPYYGNYPTAPERLNIIWEIVEEDLSAEGTVYKSGNSYQSRAKIIQGRIYSQHGQPIAIRIDVARWEFNKISQPQGNTFAPMNPISFIFSELTEKSAHDTYEVTFYVRQPNNPTNHIVEKRIFIPEGVNPATVKNKQTGVNYPGDWSYRLGWDEPALAAAKASPSQGMFTLNNNDGVIKNTVNASATYEYSRPYITDIDLGFGMGEENQAFFIINPIAPIFNYTGTGLTIPIRAKGRLNLESNVLLNDYPDYIVEALWAIEGQSAPTIPEGLLGGGVNRDFPITVRVRKRNDPSYVLTQPFKIMLVALDMSPAETINIANSNTLNRTKVKTKYLSSTYLGGAFNPYLDSYNEIISKQVTRYGVTDNAFNIAVLDNQIPGKLYDYEVLEWSDTIIEENGRSLQKSASIRVLQKVYQSDIVRRVVNTKFVVKSLNLGFGSGIDAAVYNAMTDPPAETKKTRFVYNPLELDFSRVGSPVISSPNANELANTQIILEENGVDVSTNYYYKVIWWNSAIEQSLLARKFMLMGGIIDEWKVLIEVSNASNVVANLIYNIELVFLDMRPINNSVPFINQEYQDSKANVLYGENRYQNMTNPYGESYTVELRGMLESAAAVYADTTYRYTATAWSEPISPSGQQAYQQSISVKVKVGEIEEEYITTTPVLIRPIQ